jgi:hypothetical protein
MFMNLSTNLKLFVREEKMFVKEESVSSIQKLFVWLKTFVHELVNFVQPVTKNVIKFKNSLERWK